MGMWSVGLLPTLCKNGTWTCCAISPTTKLQERCGESQGRIGNDDEEEKEEEPGFNVPFSLMTCR